MSSAATTTTTAHIALIVSIVSASLSLVGVFWQLMLYRLNGARLLVELRPALLDVSDGKLIYGPERGWPAKAPPRPELGVSSTGRTIELGHLRVTNVGRAAISVSDVSLDVGRVSRFSRHRHTIIGIPVETHGSEREQKPVRLEPGSTIFYLVDFWRILRDVRKHRTGTVAVRASARPAGRRPRRSPWHKRWRIKPGQEALTPWIDVTPNIRMSRTVWRVLPKEDSGKIEYLCDILEAELSREDATHEQIRDAISNVVTTSKGTIAMAALDSWRDDPDRLYL